MSRAKLRIVLHLPSLREHSYTILELDPSRGSEVCVRPYHTVKENERVREYGRRERVTEFKKERKCGVVYVGVCMCRYTCKLISPNLWA